MNDQTVTITIPLNVARACVGGVASDGAIDRAVEHISDAIKDALPPEYPEGTFAKVYYADQSVTFAEWHDGEWRFANGVGSYELRYCVDKVEVIRTLGPDEIAMRRVDSDPADEWRNYSITLHGEGYHDAANLAGAYADALDAADGAS